MPILFFGWLIGFIGSLFIKVGEVIFDVIRLVGPWVQQLVGALRDVVNIIASNAGRFFRFISGAVRSLYANILTPAVQALQRWFERFRGFLNRVFEPITNVFKWINEFLDKVWTKVIAPILDVIEKLRLVFRLLEELGVSWAGAVERFLQSLETRIYEAFREVRTFVTNIQSWVDFLLDPRGWIKATPWLYTLYKWSGNVYNLLLKLGIDPLNKDRLRLLREQHEPTPLTPTIERFKTGVLRQNFGMQSAVARLRSRRSGTF